MKRFGSLRRSKKRKEQDGLRGRHQSEASCLSGNPNFKLLPSFDKMCVYLYIPFVVALSTPYSSGDGYLLGLTNTPSASAQDDRTQT